MANSKAVAVQPAVSTEITPELIDFIEELALREDDPLAEQCRTALRTLRAGASRDDITSQLRPICVEFARRQASQPTAGRRPGPQQKGPLFHLPQLLRHGDVEPILNFNRVVQSFGLPTEEITTAARIETFRRKLFLTVKEAADYSGLPEATIRRLIHDGKLPAINTGGWRIKRTYLEALGVRHLRQVAKSNI